MAEARGDAVQASPLPERNGEGRAGRVLVVAPQPFYQDRGTPIAVRQVLEALSELGYQVDLLTFPMGESVTLPGLRILRVKPLLPVRDVPIGFSFSKVVLDLSLAALARRLLRSRRYVAIHAVEEAAFPCAVLARAYGVPLVYDMQSSMPEQLLDHALFRGRWRQRRLAACEAWLIRRADVIACSVGLGARVRDVDPDAVVHEWWFAAQPAEVDEAAVAALRAELGIGPRAAVVVYTGNFSAYQGVDLLLEAALRVRDEVADVVFVLVGAEPGDLETAPAGLEASDLRIVERQPRERMPLYVALADVLVSPRRHGGNLPLKIFDYLRSGKPIVATDTATHRTVLDPSRAALVDLSAQELAASISMVLRDGAVARRLGAASTVFADEHLSRESFKRRVAKLYRQAAAVRVAADETNDVPG